MKALFNNIQGMRRIALITLAVIVVGLAVFSISYKFCGDAEKSAVSASAIITVIAFVSALASASFTTIFIAFVIAIAFSSTFAPILAIITAIAFTFVTAFVFAIVSATISPNSNYESKPREFRSILFWVITAVVLVMTMRMPYLADIVLVASGAGIVFLLVESKCRLRQQSRDPGV